MGAPSLEKLPGAASGTAQAALESMEGASVDRAELLKREEALTLEAVERSLERLETRER